MQRSLVRHCIPKIVHVSFFKKSKFQCGTWIHYYTSAFLPIIVYRWNNHTYIINHCLHNQKIFSANPCDPLLTQKSYGVNKPWNKLNIYIYFPSKTNLCQVKACTHRYKQQPMCTILLHIGDSFADIGTWLEKRTVKIVRCLVLQNMSFSPCFLWINI